MASPVTFTLASEAPAVRDQLDALIAAEAGSRIKAADASLWTDDAATQDRRSSRAAATQKAECSEGADANNVWGFRGASHRKR